MEKELSEEKLKEFDQILENKKKESVKDFDTWRMFIISPWNFYFAIYNNLPLEKRTEKTIRFLIIKLIEVLLIVLALLFVANFLR